MTCLCLREFWFWLLLAIAVSGWVEAVKKTAGSRCKQALQAKERRLWVKVAGLHAGWECREDGLAGQDCLGA